MANGLSDILSVYRQSLASERQTRLAEMQLSLSALQFEAQQQFKEEGRRREDIKYAIEDATQGATEALTSDAAVIANKLSNITEIVAASRNSDTGGFTDPEKLIKKLSDKKGEYQFSPSDARSIVNVVQYHNLARVNPDLAEAAKNEAVAFGMRVSGDFEAYQRSGFDKEALKKLQFLTAMDKSNVLYLGRLDKVPDPSKIDLSVDPFIGVSQATQALQNIEIEKREIGEQDYSIDRRITMAGLTEQEQGAVDFDALVDRASGSGQISLGGGRTAQQALSSIYAEDPEDLALGPINIDIQDEVKARYNLGSDADIAELTELGLGVDYGRADETILESLSFLPSQKVEGVQIQLTDLANTISSKASNLQKEVIARNKKVDEYETLMKSYEWERSQSKLNKSLGDDAASRNNIREMKRLSKLLGLEGKSSKLRREVQAMEYSQLNPRGMLMEKRKTGYSDTHSLEILKLSQDIKKLVRQRESLGY